MPRRVPSVRLKRSALLDRPICSIIVRPAPGTISSASFSDGSIVMRYSPVIVGSTNSIMMSLPMPSIQRYRQFSNGKVEVVPPPSSIGRSIGAAGRVRLDFGGRAERDIDAAAVGLPARNTRSIPLVRIGDAAVVLFFEFVFR